MSFLSLILALLAERYLNLGKALRNHDWLPRYRRALGARFTGQAWFADWPGVVLLIFIPALAAELCLGILAGRMFNLPAMVFSTAVLLYCLGPESLWVSLKGYLEDLERGDAQGAYCQVADRVCADCADNTAQLGREVTGWVLREANARWFSVLFWFVVLGPAGAVLYRVMRGLAGKGAPDEADAGHREALGYLLGLADWVPARLTAFCYALSGDFVKAWEACRRHALAGPEANDCVLVEAGVEALALADATAESALAENRDAMALVERTLIVFVVLMSILSVLGLMW